MRPTVLVADSITKLVEYHRGQVVVAGSHGGVYCGYLVARGGLRGVILNDAGVGKDRAGIGALAYLDRLGLAAACVGHLSARIGDGADMVERGRISHANRSARALGCAVGQACSDAATAMLAAKPYMGNAPVYGEGRYVLRQRPGEPIIVGCDSASLVEPEDAGQIVVTASHGATLPESPGYALKTRALAAVFNDAGFGADGCGVARLALLDGMGIAGVTVCHDSARIGDARSAWRTGTLSFVNAEAARLGATRGIALKDFARRAIGASKAR
ncbi:MAG: hypothetical protein EXQ87_07030 [Alphaproteobacteria bacterium]|nr:hypothetical protein [Alphaproteobacteria bacterium]